MKTEAQEARPTGPIFETVDSLECAVTRLEEKLHNFHNLLSPILRQPDPPLPETAEKITDSDLCPLATRIRSLQRNIHSAATLVEDITNRLEL